MKHPDTQHQRTWWRSAKAIGAIAASVTIVTLAERDIHHRAPDQINGSKRIWQVASLNALGALAYFKWGRTEPTTHS